MHKKNPPVFIVGTPRSGTTLFRLIIDSHPEIAITPESSFLFRKTALWNRLYPDISNQYTMQLFLDDLRKLPQVKAWLPEICTARKLMQDNKKIATFSEFIDAVFTCYAQTKGKERWGDKTPKNLHAIDQIIALFPSAKILIIVRDCRDVALSLRKAEFSKVSCISAARRWQKDAAITRRAIRKYGEQISLVRYEDLLKAPGKIVKAVLDFLDLSDDPEILKHYMKHDDDVVHTKSKFYLQPVNKGNLYKWKKKMPANDVEQCEAIAMDGLQYLSYETTTTNPTISQAKIMTQRAKDLFQLMNNKKNLENYYAYFHLLGKSIVQKTKREYSPFVSIP